MIIERLTSVKAPNAVIFADKAAVRKILLEVDLPKASIYDSMRVGVRGESILYF